MDASKDSISNYIWVDSHIKPQDCVSLNRTLTNLREWNPTMEEARKKKVPQLAKDNLIFNCGWYKESNFYSNVWCLVYWTHFRPRPTFRSRHPRRHSMLLVYFVVVVVATVLLSFLREKEHKSQWVGIRGLATVGEINEIYQYIIWNY